MIRNIIFDLGNVLVVYNPSKIVKRYFEEPELQALMARVIFHSQAWRKLDQGLITYDDHYRKIVSDFPQHAEKIKNLMDNWDRETYIVKGVVPIVEALHKAGYALYILSNAHQRYLERQKHLAFFRYFKGITLSSEVHQLKPELKIYQEFCMIHNLIPDECLFIDDQLENVKGAREAGWIAHQFRDAMELKNYLNQTLPINEFD